jgi:hypothetical protein
MDVAYWDALINDWYAALAKKSVEQFFISSVENRNNLRTTYTSMAGNTERFTDWLVKMRAQAMYNPGNTNVNTWLTFGVTNNGQL